MDSMNDTPKLMTGGRLVVQALLEQGVDTVFCVPGESYLDVLDGLYAEQARVRVVTCRHEGAAAFMAEAHGKLTGRPGVCMVTRGPGATNASIGVHTAFQDSTPMILLVGQVGGDMVERDAFQEIDYRRMFGPFTKWVAQIDSAARVTEYMNRAFTVAMSGRPGPVVLALPEDMLTQSAFPAPPSGPVRVPRAWPAPAALQDMQAMLSRASRPLMVVGGSGWTAKGLEHLNRYASLNGLPVACSFRRQDLFDNRHAQYAGEVGIGINPELAQAVSDADLILAVGARLGEMATSGYTLLQSPVPRQTLVHVLNGAEELGRVYQPALAIQADLNAFAESAAALAPVDAGGWRGWLTSLRENYLRYTEPPAPRGRLDPAAVIVALRDRLDARAILTNGAGNYSAWAHRYYRHSHPNTQLAPTSGAMGYGVPAAIAAKLRHPDRQVVCLAGDGCFLMTSQELATVRQQRLAIVFIVFNNGMYGTIRMHQEMHYPGRPIATDLSNPDFVAYAQSFGMGGERVERDADFGPALTRALASGSAYLIELALDPELLTPRATLSGLRERARQATA